MKFKKEYIILICLLAGLSIYVFSQRSGRRYYELPRLAMVSAKDVTRIDIERPGGGLVMNREGDKWTLTEKAYAASDAKIHELLKIFEDFSLSALVSESKSYERYDLGPEKKITVKAYAGTRLVREFEVGKAASSLSHTFVKLPGDDRVYQAQSNFRDDFESPLDQLRDKKVLSYKEDDIAALTLTRNATALEFVRKEIPQPEPERKDPQEKGEATPAAASDKKFEWGRGDGKPVDSSKVSRTIHTLSDLLCQKFIEAKTLADFKNPDITLTFKAGEATHTLTVFAKEEDHYPAISSQSPYPFLLSSWQVENLLENLDPKPKSEKIDANAPAPATAPAGEKDVKAIKKK